MAGVVACFAVRVVRFGFYIVAFKRHQQIVRQKGADGNRAFNGNAFNHSSRGDVYQGAWAIVFSLAATSGKTFEGTN